VHRALAGERVRGAQLQVVRRDGTALWVEVNSSPLTDADGRPYGALSTYVDVTDRLERERRIRAEADTDELTGLANRHALQRMLRAALARAHAHDLSVGVLMPDLAHSERAAHDAAYRIEAAFAEPLELEGVEASLRGAVGVACHPDDGDDLESLMAAADRAMYARKAPGTGSARSTPGTMPCCTSTARTPIFTASSRRRASRRGRATTATSTRPPCRRRAGTAPRSATSIPPTTAARAR
jgi:GGDEF domain-containing protein